MENEIVISWAERVKYVRDTPLVRTYLGFKKIDSIQIYDPEPGESSIKSYAFGVPIKEGFKTPITSINLIPSPRTLIIPIKLKKAAKKNIDTCLKKPVAFWASNKNTWDTWIKSVDLYIPIGNGVSCTEEYRERTEYDHRTFDTVIYAIRVGGTPVFALRAEDNERRSPMNRFNDGLRELSDKYNHLGMRLWPSNVDDYLELAEDLKALKVKLTEYETEGDIPCSSNPTT